MSKGKKAKKRSKKRSLVKRTNNHKMTVIPKQDLLALAARAKGSMVTSDPDYFRPVMTNDQIYWVRIFDKKSKTWNEHPFVPYLPILDNLHRRGIKSITPEPLPVISCKEAGCYMHSPGDLTHRFKSTIVLRNGQEFTAYGEACVHNTVGPARKALKRVAETRAKARAGRDAVNIGVPCIVEISSFEGQIRQGDRILSQEDVENVTVEGSVVKGESTALVKTDSPTVGTPTQKKEEEVPKEYNFKAERTKQNALLHGEFSRLGLDVKAAHDYIHRMDKVASLKDLDAAKLADWVNNFAQVKVDSPNHARLKEMMAGAKA